MSTRHVDKSHLGKDLKSALKKTTTTSKHSKYQTISRRLAKLVDFSEIDLKPKYEVERLNYILSKIDVRDKTILDIGCNTGFFSFELLDAGVQFVEAFEGGRYHFDFVRLAIKFLEIESKYTLKNEYYQFNDEHERVFHLTLLLNVLHHFGDDYGESIYDIVASKGMMMKQLNHLASKTKFLALQLGFNLHGNINQCLFNNGTKGEMISFVKEKTCKYWEMIDIGIAEKSNGAVKYADVNDSNIHRQDELGEFLNRPLFIMKSKHFG